MQRLDDAIRLRESGNPAESLKVLELLLDQGHTSAAVWYQAAWACDCLGKEAKAAEYYESAIAAGLAGDDLRGALLGLGSTYRCLGEYEKSLAVFGDGVARFPEDKAIQAFRALTLYNLGQYEDSVATLLKLLVETTANQDIRAYSKALNHYATTLNHVHKEQ